MAGKIEEKMNKTRNNERERKKKFVVHIIINKIIVQMIWHD